MTDQPAATPDQIIRKQRRSRKIMRRLSIGLLVVTIFLAAICGWAYYKVTSSFDAPGDFSQDETFVVPKGAGISRIAANLEAANLIENGTFFKLMIRTQSDKQTLKAGEYLIPAQSSMRDIYAILAEGKAIVYPLTIPEGLTSAQILRIVLAFEPLTSADPALPAEGTLLPETYLVPRGMSASDLLDKMKADQKAVIDRLWESRAPDLPVKTKDEAIILASIVEKETGISGERDLVAGVFTNRLRRGMRLESDPTIIYGITQGEPLGRGIRRSEIDRKTEWNTYQINGLPKTPICNPGKEAIQAVLNPAETDAIFFVADGTGGHVFSRTYAEHNANVAKWRKIEQQRRRQQRSSE